MVTKYNLQRYYPNQGYHKLHCEKNGKQVSDRVMAWMIYLNTVTDKGQTYFPQHQVKVKAERGKLVRLPVGLTSTKELQVKLKQNILLLVGCLLRSRPFMVSIIP